MAQKCASVPSAATALFDAPGFNGAASHHLNAFMAASTISMGLSALARFTGGGAAAPSSSASAAAAAFFFAAAVDFAFAGA